MNRSPLPFSSTPPSPRTPSVISVPRTLGGQTMPVGMELNELHVDEVGPGPHRHRVPVGRVLPRVRRDLPAPPDAARRQHHRLRLEHDEPPALALIAEAAGHAVAVLQESSGSCTPCARRCPGARPYPAACESSPGRCDRPRAPAADTCARRNSAAESGRPWCDRTRRPTLRARARAPALPGRAAAPSAID